MKLFRCRLLAFIVCVFGLQTNVSAQENCSYIEFLSDSESDIRINKVNGQLMYGGPRSYNKWKRTNLVKVVQGHFELVGSVVDKDILQKLKNGSDHFDSIAPVYFALNVKAGEYHQISIIRENGEVKDIDVDTKKITGCPFNDYLEVETSISEDLVDIITLSEVEKNNLQQLFFNISEQNPVYQNQLSSVSPAGFSADIGIIFNKFRMAHEGIEVLSVTPLSVANQLGLQSGDILLTINEQTLSGDFREKSNLFDAAVTKIDRDVVLTLKRGERHLSLRSDLDELFIPKYQYSVNEEQPPVLVNYVPLMPASRYQLDHQISQIVTKYSELFPEAKNFKISIPASVESRLGVTGVNDKQYNGVKINFVADGSTAQQLGINVGDILLSINDIESINENNTSGEKHTLLVNKRYQVSILRQNKPLEFVKDVFVKRLPQVELNIQLQSQQQYVSQLEYQAKVARRLSRNHSAFPSFWKTPNSYRLQSGSLPYSRGEKLATSTRIINTSPASSVRTSTASQTKSN